MIFLWWCEKDHIYLLKLWTTELCSFSNLSITSPTSQLILQPFHHFTYVTAHSPTLPLLHLRPSSFSNSSFTSHMSQALHLRHLMSHPWLGRCSCTKNMGWSLLIYNNIVHVHCGPGSSSGKVFGYGLAAKAARWLARAQACKSGTLCHWSVT